MPRAQVLIRMVEVQMKVLVTGGTGFIGSNLTRRLVDLGHKVNVLVRPGSNLGKIAGLEVEKTSGDLGDYQSLVKAMNGRDVVFNLAAGLPYHKLSSEEYTLANDIGVKNIVQACLKAEVKRLVHVSTVGVYGATLVSGVDESAPLNLTDHYSRTKALGDKHILEAVKAHGLPAVIIRPTIAYGPGDTRPGFLNLFVLIKKRMFVPVGGGENYFHTIYIENLVDGLLLAASHKNVIGEDFIIGDDPCPKMKEIIQTIARVEKTPMPIFNIPTSVAFLAGLVGDIARLIGLPFPLNIQRVRFITQNRRYITHKASKKLGYKPKIALEEGIKRTYLWYQKHGFVN